MSHDEYTSQLVRSLFEEENDPIVFELKLDESLPEAPLNNFFGDVFLTLLYRCNDSIAEPLIDIKQHLLSVTDLAKPRHVRAKAAVALGRFIQHRYPDEQFRIGSSRPEQWFLLARQLNSVVGAFALANVLLAQQNLRIQFDLEADPLPRLVYIIERNLRSTPQVSSESAHAFYLGARVALRHVHRRFEGWNQQSFRCALACIVNYLTHIPTSRISDRACPIQQRREALTWIKPLWNRLIDAMSEQPRDAEARRVELVEQQLAVLLYLDDIEENGVPDKPSLTPGSKRVASKPGPNQMVVVSGAIPGSSDRAETDYLKQFEVLRKPMTFKPLPSLGELYGLREMLSEEFPWAQEAITLIMSDLLARRRHGVLRLGMAPVLLVGPPGTGKTRFVQRLGELLGTPNTVINLAGMTDVKVLKGVTRGWANNRTSRIVEFIQQTKVPNPIFILDEIDKARPATGNGGDPQEALLDLLEPGNARRYQDVYLMSECDLSHCLYIATSNSLSAVSEPLLSRLRPVLFPAPGPEYSGVILRGIVRDMERTWNLPQGALMVTPRQAALLHGLSPREMRRALLELLGNDGDDAAYVHH
ncbi:AAA family ATPase [Alcaligenaceae bacterium]|nr:AAA family ATPase [Alcaligenaceae bacterium]